LRIPPSQLPKIKPQIKTRLEQISENPYLGKHLERDLSGYMTNAIASFDCSIWRHALSENRRASNRQRLQMLEKVWHAIEKLNHAYQWDELYVFGSATKSERFGELNVFRKKVASLRVGNGK
jgi:hypothetical protein